MSHRRETSTRPEIIIVAKGLNDTEMSKADITRRIRRLTEEFSATIVTGSPNAATHLFPRANRVIGIPTTGVRWGSGLFIIACLLIVPFLRGEMVYLSETYNAPCILTNCRRPVVCYGSTHPVQHEIRTGRGLDSIRGLASRIYMSLLMRGLRACRSIVVISPQLKSEFARLGIREAAIVVSGVGVPIESFRPPVSPIPPPTGPWICVYHGTISEERGLSIIVDGIGILASRRKDFRIRLVGCTDSQVIQIGERLRRQGTEDFVELRPSVPYSQIPQILWSSHIGLSLLEPNVYFSASPPVKVLEYKAAGLPVIANDIPTHHIFLKDKEDSIIIRYDPGSFAEAIESMIQDRNLWLRLSSKASGSWRTHSDEGPIDTLVNVVKSSMTR